ncbi:unnamed protein product [Cochlearia groenlandica]
MDTLSAANVSSLNLTSLPPPQPLRRSISRRFKSTVNSTAASANLSKPTSSSSSSYSSLNKTSNFLAPISFPLQQNKPSKPPSPPPLHDKAASGFAAALVSVCQSKNCLGRTQEDVRRLMEFLVRQENKMNNKVFFVNDVVEKSKFGKHLKGLVKLLSARGKSALLFHVLKEFDRISNELVLV